MTVYFWEIPLIHFFELVAALLHRQLHPEVTRA